MQRSVREGHVTPEEHNRPVMTVADSPKKRKRALSPHSNKKVPIHLTETKVVDMALGTTKVGMTFDQALGNDDKLAEYRQAHEHLLELEAQDAWDRDARPRNASRSKESETERRAARIIHAIREYERRVTFGNLASEAIPGPDTRDMGGQFLTNKDRIEMESKLYEIAKMVPKAALLHLHFNAELHPERLLEQARSMDTMYIRSIRPILSQQDLDETETVFTILDPSLVEPNVNIFSEDYPGGPLNWKLDEWKWKVWMPWSEFQKQFEVHFPHKYVQQEDTIMFETPHCCSEPGQVSLHPAENWLKSKMVLSQEEAYGFTQTVNGYVFLYLLPLIDTYTNAAYGLGSIKLRDASRVF